MRKLLVAAAALIAFAISGPAIAQAPGPLAGTIAFSTKSIGFILGVEWGSGTVTLRGGRVVHLRVRTLKVGMAGLESVAAQGRVYNLNIRRPQDIAGTYASIGGGLTVGGGIGAQRMKNEKGVIIDIEETAAGLAAKIAASGIVIDVVK